MSKRRMSVVIAAAALMSAVAGGAYAADKPAKPMDFTVRSEPTTVAPNSGRALKYDASKGRFGFTLGVQQPDGRERAAEPRRGYTARASWRDPYSFEAVGLKDGQTIGGATYAVSPDARNMTAAVMSAGTPSRPRGMRFRS